MADLAKVMQHFPDTAFSFAYGSGVFQQTSYAPISQPWSVKGASPTVNNATQESIPPSNVESPMIDLIFVVNDPVEWHAKNMQQNGSHYAGFARFIGPEGVAHMQEDLSGTVLGSLLGSSDATAGGARLWYNTLVPAPTSAVLQTGAKPLLKYGVMSLHALLEDCLTWRSLYAAGRLHKPVLTITCAQPAVILAAARENLRHALRAALLMLPASFTCEQLYTTIAGLSYGGDWRMTFGENPHKVRNIVSGNLQGFHDLYAPLLATSFPHVVPSDCVGRGLSMPGRYTQDVSPEARLALGMSLPLRVQQRMAEAWHVEQGRAPLWSSRRQMFLSSPSGSASGPLSSRAFALAQRGREFFARLRQARLQALLSRQERKVERTVLLAERLRNSGVRALFHKRLGLLEERTSLQRGNPSLSTLLAEADHTAVSEGGTLGTSSNYNRAASDPMISSFWESLLGSEPASTASPSALLSSAPFISFSSSSTPTHLPQDVEQEAGQHSSSLKDVPRPTRRASSPVLRRSLSEDVGRRASVFLRPALAHVVGRAARMQSIKGIITAGPSKAALYSAAKLRKYFKAVLKNHGGRESDSHAMTDTPPAVPPSGLPPHVLHPSRQGHRARATADTASTLLVDELSAVHDDDHEGHVDEAAGWLFGGALREQVRAAGGDLSARHARQIAEALQRGPGYYSYDTDEDAASSVGFMTSRGSMDDVTRMGGRMGHKGSRAPAAARRSQEQAQPVPAVESVHRDDWMLDDSLTSELWASEATSSAPGMMTMRMGWPGRARMGHGLEQAQGEELDALSSELSEDSSLDVFEDDSEDEHEDEDEEEEEEEEEAWADLPLTDPRAAWHIPAHIEVTDHTRDEDVGQASVLMCKLDWPAYRTGPSVYPFFDDLVQASGCGPQTGPNADGRGQAFYVTLAELESAWFGGSRVEGVEYHGPGHGHGQGDSVKKDKGMDGLYGHSACGHMHEAQSSSEGLLGPSLSPASAPTVSHGQGLGHGHNGTQQLSLPPAWACIPTGLIHHQTRTGSTLIANMMGALNHTLLFSEAQPPQSIVRARRLSFEAKVRWLRVIMAALARPIHAAARGMDWDSAAPGEHALQGWRPSALYLKTQHTTVLWADVYRAAFGSTPWMFVHREPTAILMSMLRSKHAPNASDAAVGVDQHLPETVPRTLNSSTPCLRTRTWPAPIPGFIAQAARAHDPDYPLGEQEGELEHAAEGKQAELDGGGGYVFAHPPPLSPQPTLQEYRRMGTSALHGVHAESWCALDLAHVAAAAMRHAMEARAQAVRRAAWLAHARAHMRSLPGSGHRLDAYLSGLPPAPHAFHYEGGPIPAAPARLPRWASGNITAASGGGNVATDPTLVDIPVPSVASPALAWATGAGAGGHGHGITMLDLANPASFEAVMHVLAPTSVSNKHGQLIASSFPASTLHVGLHSSTSSSSGPQGSGSVLGVGLPLFMSYPELPAAVPRLLDSHFASPGRLVSPHLRAVPLHGDGSIPGPGPSTIGAPPLYQWVPVSTTGRPRSSPGGVLAWEQAALGVQPSLYGSRNITGVAEAALWAAAKQLYNEDAHTVDRAVRESLKLFLSSFHPRANDVIGRQRAEGTPAPLASMFPWPTHLSPMDFVLMSSQSGQYSKARATASELAKAHATSTTISNSTTGGTEGGHKGATLKTKDGKGPRLPYANVDADGKFQQDDGVKAQQAWPALLAAGHRYMLPLHQAMVAFTTPTLETQAVANAVQHAAEMQGNGTLHAVYAPRGALTVHEAVSLMGGRSYAALRVLTAPSPSSAEQQRQQEEQSKIRMVTATPAIGKVVVTPTLQSQAQAGPTLTGFSTAQLQPRPPVTVPVPADGHRHSHGMQPSPAAALGRTFGVVLDTVRRARSLLLSPSESGPDISGTSTIAGSRPALHGKDRTPFDDYAPVLGLSLAILALLFALCLLYADASSSKTSTTARVGMMGVGGTRGAVGMAQVKQAITAEDVLRDSARALGLRVSREGQQPQGEREVAAAAGEAAHGLRLRAPGTGQRRGKAGKATGVKEASKLHRTRSHSSDESGDTNSSSSAWRQDEGGATGTGRTRTPASPRPTPDMHAQAVGQPTREGIEVEAESTPLVCTCAAPPLGHLSRAHESCDLHAMYPDGNRSSPYTGVHSHKVRGGRGSAGRPVPVALVPDSGTAAQAPPRSTSSSPSETSSVTSLDQRAGARAGAGAGGPAGLPLSDASPSSPYQRSAQEHAP